MTHPAPVLEVSGLNAGYGQLTAVSDVSLTVSRGEVVALFGPNGAGKTTTLMATVGAMPRRHGTVLWHGAAAPRTLHGLSRAGLAFVPEKRSVISSLSTHDNLRLGRGTVAAALQYFPELAEHLHLRAGLLSGGQQQILMLARALAAHPQALLVDEMSLGLAPAVVERLLAALRRAADEEGLAVLLVEQQMRRALAVADRWYLIARGTTAAAGRADVTGSCELEAAYVAGMGIGAAGADAPSASAAVPHRAPSADKNCAADPPGAAAPSMRRAPAGDHNNHGGAPGGNFPGHARG